MNLCPISGEDNCTCISAAVTVQGKLMMMDVKACLRKLFTDHVVYTNWLILVSDDPEKAKEISARLLKNPTDFKNLLSPIIGKFISTNFEQLLSEHLKLAASLIPLLKEDSCQLLEKTIHQFYANGSEFARLLSTIDSAKLTFEYAKITFDTHLNFVLKLAVLHHRKKWDEYVKTYDLYYKHMLMFSDVVYESLTL